MFAFFYFKKILCFSNKGNSQDVLRKGFTMKTTTIDSCITEKKVKRSILSHFSYFSWYIAPSKTLWVKIPILIDVCIVLAMSIINGFMGLLSMIKMGGFYIFVTGVGFVFPLFPILLAIIYSRFPITIEQKYLSKCSLKSEILHYAILILSAILMRIFVCIGFYFYRLVLFV